MLGILWFLFWQALGIALSRFVFIKHRQTVRLWLGSVIGSVLSAWMPIPFAFLFDFSMKAHLFAFIAGLLILGILIACFIRIKPAVRVDTEEKSDRPLLFLFIPFMALWILLVYNHTLLPLNDAYYTGQSTYGDMSMHLGFITSIAEQQTFPPEYNILPGVKVCYPFLCDSISSSLYLLGTPLSWAYMIPMFFAFAHVFCGAWFIAREFCRRTVSAVIAVLLFFFNGGLGMIYFVKDYSLKDLLTGFYVTPTNLTEKGMRWVNVIADMLLPQRATLFGWAALFAVLYLLFLAVFRGKDACMLPAGIIGGLLPMIHTHSYFALGLMALAWMIITGIRQRFSWQWLKRWLYFGVPAVVLAAPQLIIWTLSSVTGNSHFLRLNFDWVNGGQENWFWFWFKNVGPVFILAPLAFVFGDREKRTVFSGSILIFVICEFLVFQPNVYDDNKLLYIGYFFGCLLAADKTVDWIFCCKSPKVRALWVSVLMLVCSNAAVFTLLREAVSGMPKYAYELFSSYEIESAEYIKENCDPDSVFLTDDNHDNAVAVLTGRNIVCGSGSYLYYHGVDYTPQQVLAEQMLLNPDTFEANKESSGIDYVYVGTYERAMGCAEAYFASHYRTVFENAAVAIYDVNQPIA